MIGFVDGEMKRGKYARCWCMALLSLLSKHHLLKTNKQKKNLLSLEGISRCFIIDHPKAQWQILLLLLLVLHYFVVNILSVFKPRLKIITVKYGSWVYTSPAGWQFWSRMASIAIVCLCSTWFLILWQASLSLFTQGPGKAPKESEQKLRTGTS